MDSKHWIGILVVISLFFSGCAPAYRFLKVKEDTKGYLVKKGRTEMTYFTVDTSQQYPVDLKLAKKRFRRRRKFLERYYKEKCPEEFSGAFMTGMKFLAFYIVVPISCFVMDYYINRPGEEITEEQVKQFIEEDCRKE